MIKLIELTKMFEAENKKNNSVSIDMDELKYIKKYIGLTVSEKEFLFDLMTHVSIGTNMIIDEESNALTQGNLAKVLKIEVKSLQRKFKSLSDKKLIYGFKQWNKLHYIINPYIMKSGLILKDIYEIFDELGYKGESYDNSVLVDGKLLCINKEKDLEKILSSHLHFIEEGLTLIKTQYEVENGFIDILAKDKNETTTIIELKVKHDPNLKKQCAYYPTQFKENVRMVTISPEYTQETTDYLKSLGNIEMKTYSVKNNQISIHNYN